MSLQVGEMPDSNPALQVLQSGALQMSHHICLIEPPHPHPTSRGMWWFKNFTFRKSKRQTSYGYVDL